MGNLSNKPESICETLDMISSNYILSMDYHALSHMGDEDYCNKFTLITKDLLDNKFNKLDIKYLTIRIKKGHKPLIDIFNNKADIPTYETITNEDKVFYSNDITDENKPQMCLNISRFYIKIGHLFAAIVTALDPVYMVDGKPYPFNTPKKDIPDHSILEISENGICHKKIMALQFGYIPDQKLNPRFCNINANYSSIYNYNGIPELENLYYDKIDSNGKPYMSDKNRNQYLADLHLLYSQFNTTKSTPSSNTTESQPSFTEITNFKDISLKEYHNNINCTDNTYNTPITKSEKDNILFIDYADNLKDMLLFSKQKERFFLSVINEIFVHSSEVSSTPNTNKTSIIINPNLTDDRLNELINTVRNNLLEYYLKIDEYFNNGIDIYTAIVLYRKLHKQLDNINEVNSNSTNEYDNITPPQQQQPITPIENNEDIYEENDDEYGEDDDSEQPNDDVINTDGLSPSSEYDQSRYMPLFKNNGSELINNQILQPPPPLPPQIQPQQPQENIINEEIIEPIPLPLQQQQPVVPVPPPLQQPEQPVVPMNFPPMGQQPQPVAL